MKVSGAWAQCALAVAVVVGSVGCRDAVVPSAPAVSPLVIDSPLSGYALAQNATPEESPAPDQMDVAGDVPGFGGYFLDESGAPTVYLTDPSHRAEAEAALAGFLADRGFTAADLQVRQGTYEYAQLDAWYRQARPDAFSVAGIILGDVDEANNRIRFGVANADAVAALQGALVALGVPSDAVIVQERAPIGTVATLRQDITPLQGGLQINFLNVGGVVGVSLLCTLGFNAISDGVSSFITNSHCSNVEGGSETPTDYYQPLQDTDGDRLADPENLIGTEAHDPHWSLSLDCPLPGFQCRWSDASRAAYIPSAAAEAQLGRIARTVRPSTSLDDVELTIDGFFNIRREQPRGVVGEIANKVGRTTGWTFGRTTETCVDVLALGTTHIRLCQEIVSAVVDGGDSGSPVFRRRGDGSNVILLGVLWGGSVDDTNPEFVYSPMFGIERELGALTTF
jgi:hypothetical protein